MVISEASWCSPPEKLMLNENEVHVWRVVVDLQVAHVLLLEQTLAAHERVRATQFRFLKDRTRFIIVRGLLRAILGRYVAKEPSVLQFCYSHHGKPSLASETEYGVHFNVTHSHELALYAVTRDRDIGIDLEYIHKDIAYEHIAESFFSPYELRMLYTAGSDERRREVFFRCWTRKEAYLKARGLGLLLDWRTFDVVSTQEPLAMIVRTRERMQENQQENMSWSLYDLSPGLGYVGAFALEGRSPHLEYWQWSGE